MNFCVIKVPCVRIKLSTEGNFVTHCEWVEEELVSPHTELLQEVAKQIKEYFKGNRKYFNLPIKPQGSSFSQAVWQGISAIPYGETISYSELAKRAGRPKAVRAAGTACGKNPLAIIVPCHRVIGKNNDGVYTGGLAFKYALWHIEHIASKNK